MREAHEAGLRSAASLISAWPAWSAAWEAHLEGVREAASREPNGHARFERELERARAAGHADLAAAAWAYEASERSRFGELKAALPALFASRQAELRRLGAYYAAWLAMEKGNRLDMHVLLSSCSDPSGSSFVSLNPCNRTLEKLGKPNLPEWKLAGPSDSPFEPRMPRGQDSPWGFELEGDEVAIPECEPRADALGDG